MASSSSSVPTAGRWTYDVFLSFRGEDTRNNFVDHLYAALDQTGIYVFKDDKRLRTGKPISPELLKAIEESRFAVVVFSTNYANSSWCLDELAKIMECQDRMGQRVLPVFYHVDPSDVRGQKRDFATAFQQHEVKFRGEMDKVNKWRDALAGAANLSGWHIKKTDNGGESTFINKIVQRILGDTKPRGTENNLIGIDSHMDVLSSLLGLEATTEVRIVGILGMGGIGKTTIAKALFRRIGYQFEGSSFVHNVREKSSSDRDICALQQKILRNILAANHGFKIEDPEDGANMIRERLCNKKILLVLDDVDDVKQLEFLAATREWFGPGSRIIVTTRDEHLLSDANAKYKPAFLLMDQAVELFCRHAFRENNPPKGYEELSYRAIRCTGHLPLALKVLGSYFHGRQQAGVWESALDKLAKTQNNDILKSLKLSFDGLDVSEKNIFLDIACFFKGKDEEYVTRVLDCCGFDPVIGISVLIEKSLITVSKKRLDMHDLIQEMGLKIVRESFPNSRLWKVEEIHDCIKRNTKLEAIEAIFIQPNPFENYEKKLGFSADVFERMKNLRLLDISRRFTCAEPTILPDELRWLRWNDYPFSSLPIGDLRNLVGLDMVFSRIEHLWKGQKILPNLKFIRLQFLDRLTKFPDVSQAPNLERLILSNCENLVEVHESLGFHKMLVYLKMKYCKKLRCLPSRIEMESLETLIISNCKSLERFPEISPCMVNLSYIDLKYCCKLMELPSSIRYLSGLSLLDLTSCSSLENIPNSICELQHLKSLYLLDCHQLQKLPEELGSMEKLEELHLGLYSAPRFSINFHILTSLSSLKKLDLGWREIEDEDFPKNLHACSSLEELYLSGNTTLTRLPASISGLSRLKRLELNRCYHLQNLHGLPRGIQVLKASGCKSLEKIEDLSKEYEWLYNIWLNGCKKLLEDQENERYLNNMLQQSFLKKFAAVDLPLSIGIPGSKIPSWFKQEQHGSEIALKLPPKWQTQIMGFAVCAVFYKEWSVKISFPDISFTFKNDGTFVPEPESEVNSINACAAAAKDRLNMWIFYIPFGFFCQMCHDLQHEGWSRIEGNLVIGVKAGNSGEFVRCGGHIVYKKDVESIEQIKTCISDYGNLVHVPRIGNALVCREKHKWETDDRLR